MTFKIPVSIVDQIGNPYEPTKIEEDSIVEHIYRYELIEPSWIRSIVVNAQDLGDRPHTIIVRGYFMNDINDPFILCFCAGAPPEVAVFSHDELKKSA